MDTSTTEYEPSSITTSVSDGNTARAILEKVLTLAVKDIDNRKLIVEETVCMTGIVTYLLHKEADVRVLAARIALLLSNHPQSKSKMKQFPNLVSNLVSA